MCPTRRIQTGHGQVDALAGNSWIFLSNDFAYSQDGGFLWTEEFLPGDGLNVVRNHDETKRRVVKRCSYCLRETEQAGEAYFLLGVEFCGMDRRHLVRGDIPTVHNCLWHASTAAQRFEQLGIVLAAIRSERETIRALLSKLFSDLHQDGSVPLLFQLLCNAGSYTVRIHENQIRVV